MGYTEFVFSAPIRFVHLPDSAYYNSTVSVEILSNHKLDPDVDEDPSETIFRREVNLVCLNQVWIAMLVWEKHD